MRSETTRKSSQHFVATLSNCGESLKLHLPSGVRKRVVAGAAPSGTVKTVEMHNG